ncbi:MAG: STAS domain-containing protein [Roseiflexaceae bacterium]
MNNEQKQPDIKRLKAQVAALEQLIEVYEQTALEQADRLEQALRLREQAEEELTGERNALREIVGQQQRLIDTIRQLSAPLLPVHDGVLVMPLIGHIDSARGAQIMEELLNGVQQHQAAFVIMDITGVPIVDTAVANHLIQTTHAVSLLGAHCILVGISPEVAQTLVQLGIDFQRLTTRSNLQAGITYAISHHI